MAKVEQILNGIDKLPGETAYTFDEVRIRPGFYRLQVNSPAVVDSVSHYLVVGDVQNTDGKVASLIITYKSDGTTRLIPVSDIFKLASWRFVEVENLQLALILK